MKMTRLLTAALVAATSIMLASSAFAADVHEIRREANHLKAKANELKGLFHAHYRHAHNYRELECAVLEFRELGTHIREHAFHDSCDIAGLREDIRLAERKFATVEHAAYVAEHSVVRRNPGKAGIAKHIRKIMHQTAFCLNEFSDLVNPVFPSRFEHNHNHFDSRAYDRGRSRWPTAQPPRPEPYRGGNSIRLGDSNFSIRFNF